MLSTSKYPSMTRYLQSLPNGLDSYPECNVKADAFENILTDFPDLAKNSDFPTILSNFFKGNHKTEWISEVVANCILYIVRETQFSSDSEFKAWAYNDSLQVFKKPIYRVLMFILSPSLVVMGSSKRWQAFHSGSTLSCSVPKKEAGGLTTDISLEYPAHLFQDVVLERQAQAFLAALAACSGQDAQVSYREISDTQTTFTASWK